MRFAFVYHGGSVPEESRQENDQAWGKWIATLHEQAGVRVGKARTISNGAVTDYKGDISGISFIEANSLADALALAQRCPGLPYGGSVDVFEEYQD
ncbi:MAG TPA: YciI family protein [Ktedonobacteraceae bacterium]|nr:YciI family protein [Ktedonobacteraceae bacterium]